MTFFKIFCDFWMFFCDILQFFEKKWPALCLFLHFFDTVTLQKDEEKSEIRRSKSDPLRCGRIAARTNSKYEYQISSTGRLTAETNTNFQMSKILHRMPGSATGYGKNKLGTNPSSRKATKDWGHKGEFKVKRQREKSKRKDWP